MTKRWQRKRSLEWCGLRMSNSQGSRPYHFTLSQFFILVLGIAIGFAPIQLWRSRQRPQMFAIDIRLADVPTDLLGTMELPDSNEAQHRVVADATAVVTKLNELSASRFAHDWSGAIQVTDGTATRMELGQSLVFPVVANDGTPSTARRYEGTQFELKCDRLLDGDLLLTFELSDAIPDYSKAIVVGNTRVPPDFVRRVASQIVIPKGRHVAVACGKKADRDGLERELIVLFSAKPTGNSSK